MGRRTVTPTFVVAVSDSAAAFGAAAVAVTHALRWGARLHLVSVVEDSDLRLRLDAPHGPAPGTTSGPTPDTDDRRVLAATAALTHVSALCAAAGVPCTAVRRRGHVAEQVLAEVRAVDATLVVMARVDRPGHALPYLGSQTERVLEFATVPVLVVPVPPAPRAAP
ncbi:universal stress protein [Cellulomonas soli]|uniref:universal stress protein n=1 Tax=Cellulomonas soli TaxID=931535 RepID=UPI003F84EC32